MTRFFSLILVATTCWLVQPCCADDSQPAALEKFTRQQKLRGSITPERAWWDLLHCRLDVSVVPENRSLKGSNTIRFKVLKAGQKMQIDLQQPLKITCVLYDGKEQKFTREGAVYWIEFGSPISQGTESSVQIFYEGVPLKAKRPPWEGGLVWQKDETGQPFIATACQGIGASVWWPCKDHGYDEPDEGMEISITVPEKLVAVSNGRLKVASHDIEARTRTFHWQVTQPINNYCVNMNIGNYVRFSDSFNGEGGRLDLEYWVLAHQKKKARKHFKEAPRTLAAFEHWFGKYPFYKDSYKLVVVPYTGMEHQSSVTYGNGFENGYRGRDLSGTGVGLLFDFIIVHETGHEWFGNNISMKDVADMWIHEGFANYAENLFVEYHFSKKQAEDYVIGCRNLVKNDRPIIGTYDVHQEGSGDMYYKGGNMLHTIRHVIDDDAKWRSILRGLNQKFRHQTVTTTQIENYLSEESGINLTPFFDQYLRTTKIPVLHWQIDGSQLSYHLDNVVQGFSYPVKIYVDGNGTTIIPTTKMQTKHFQTDIGEVTLDRNFYFDFKLSE